MGGNSQTYSALYVIKKKLFFSCLCMYKMVVEITKETWEKCGIKAVKYNEEKNIIELWHKMSDNETQTKHSSIDDVALTRIRKYCGKKNQKASQKKKKKIQSIFWR